MKKRMTILALLLAGAVTLGSYGMVQAGQEKREVPVAGVTQTLAQVLKERRMLWRNCKVTRLWRG